MRLYLNNMIFLKKLKEFSMKMKIEDIKNSFRYFKITNKIVNLIEDLL